MEEVIFKPSCPPVVGDTCGPPPLCTSSLLGELLPCPPELLLAGGLALQCSVWPWQAAGSGRTSSTNGRRMRRAPGPTRRPASRLSPARLGHCSLCRVMGEQAAWHAAALHLVSGLVLRGGVPVQSVMCPQMSRWKVHQALPGLSAPLLDHP